MCALSIVQQQTKVYYHGVSQDYDFDEQLKNIGKLQSYKHPKKPPEEPKSLLPQRSAILELMAQLPALDFPELIEQILIENYQHTRGDITDGPGDQGRDIHTITSNGEKQLTQCRHTENPHEPNLNRRDLDELWSSTGRLRYEKGLLVTNADMTTPTKTLYRSGEYSRGGYPGLTVWNGRDLWEELRDNQNLLNRWFSGLAQLHSVKRFSFRILPVLMPDREPADLEDHIRIFIEKVIEQGYSADESGVSWRIENKDIIVFMREWFASIANLFIPCSLKAPYDLVTAPISVLEFHVVNKTDRRIYESVREQLSTALMESYQDESDKWVTILSSPLTAPVFIHDTQDIILTGIRPYRSYVLFADRCSEEILSAVSTNCEFLMEDDDDLFYKHKDTGVEFSVGYSQPIYESSDDTLKVILKNIDSVLKQSAVCEVEYKNRFEFSMALAATDFTNLVLGDDDSNKLYFCFPLEKENKETIERVIKEFIRSLSLQKISVNFLEKDQISDLRQRLPEEIRVEKRHETFCNKISNLSLPIDFTSRIIMSIADIDLPATPPDYEKLAIELFKYKMLEQHKNGFDEGFKVGDNAVSMVQLKNILWRPMQITGEKSINFGLNGYPESIKLIIVFRFRKNESLEVGLTAAHNQTMEHVNLINSLIEGL